MSPRLPLVVAARDRHARERLAVEHGLRRGRLEVRSAPACTWSATRSASRTRRGRSRPCCASGGMPISPGLAPPLRRQHADDVQDRPGHRQLRESPAVARVGELEQRPWSRRTRARSAPPPSRRRPCSVCFVKAVVDEQHPRLRLVHLDLLSSSSYSGFGRPISWTTRLVLGVVGAACGRPRTPPSTVPGVVPGLRALRR